MEILVDTERLIEARKIRGMTQEKLGRCLGGSRRLVQRIEDSNQAVSIPSDEMNKLANCLGIEPFQLWGELPYFYEFEVQKVEGGAQLADLMRRYPVDKFDVTELPSIDEEQEALVKLAEIADELKRGSTNSSFKREIQQRLDIKNACDTVCGVYRRNADYDFDSNWIEIYFSIVNRAEVDGLNTGVGEPPNVFWCTYLNLEFVRNDRKPKSGSYGTRSWVNTVDELTDFQVLAKRYEVGFQLSPFHIGEAARLDRAFYIKGGE